MLHRVAAPTGARGSILLMSGGLIVVGFLFLAFLFRSAIVGDLAPIANARAPTPRVRLPATEAPTRAAPAPPRTRAFDRGREKGRGAGEGLDAAFDALRGAGIDARVLRSGPTVKRVRLYACASCEADEVDDDGCEWERGLLVGTFEAWSGDLVKVHEVACIAKGAPHCEFEIRHAPPGDA